METRKTQIADVAESGVIWNHLSFPMFFVETEE